MAAAILKALLDKEGQAWKISSAGVWAVEGIPAAPRAVQVMAQRGLDVSGHRAQSINRELLEQADLILTMERVQKESLTAVFPFVAGRVFLLGEMDGSMTEVADPYGGPLKGYQAAAARIEQILQGGLQRIRSLVETG